MEVSLARLLATLGEPLVEVVAAPHGLDVRLDGVAIVDPDDDPADHPGRLVLVIGARGRDAVRPVRAAARHGAVAVAVKTGPGAVTELRDTGVDAGVAVLAVRQDVRWDHLEQLVLGVLDEGDPADDDRDGGDLYSLAQTVGLLTGGLVSIEDTGSRVLAYSRSDAAGSDATGPDELRRLSILGWQGPADYLATLRGWGVFDRLRVGEEVVHVDEHAELGIRRRLAVGIHAGRRQLGTIWVQEGATPFAERSESVLVGAARVAARHLARRRSRESPGTRWSRDVVAGLLDGRVGPDLVAGTFGIDERTSAVVVAFTVAPENHAPENHTESHTELGVAELAEVVGVHAATFRRSALTAAVGPRAYAVLPGVTATHLKAVRTLCTEVATIVRRRTGVRVLAGIGSVVDGLAHVPESRADADRVLAALRAGVDVAEIGDLRAEILLDQTLARVADLHDPAVDRLLAHDAEHGSELAPSVLAYLDALGDVRAAATGLTVHPNTLRYRLRRATDVAGLALRDPSARVVHHLHLLAALRPSAPSRRASPVGSDNTRIDPGS